MATTRTFHDIAIVVCSRGREDLLTRLLDDIDDGFAPALAAGGLSVCTFVYAQAYRAPFLDGLRQRFAAPLASGRLIIVEAAAPHSRIGDVFATATAILHARVDYRLAITMDDDSRYRAAPDIDANLRQAAHDFLDGEARAFSIKLGQARTLEYTPFVDPEGPIMPFKEKMLWLNRSVMEQALDWPAFATLDVGEDAVLAALAWRGGAERCFGVFGIASFLHLAFEADEEGAAPSLAGGYGELVAFVEGRDHDPELGKYGKAFRGGVVPFSVMPDIFVGPDHPHHTISGIRPEALARYGVGRASAPDAVLASAATQSSPGSP
ncbi:MAG: hypothetical protein MUC44_05010 [Beijerinckiaceae bacterium]|nr:hypothetical protein [Beijerinckiaceae bacterium]